MNKKIKFGFCVPVFANPGVAFFRTPSYKKLDWDSLKDSVILCEELGYDSIFIADHLFLGRDGDIWECMTLMSAFSAITSRVQINPIHLCNNFRSPSMVAKMLTTISHISNGRVDLFYDYGWRKAEFDAYGFDFCNSDKDRVNQMSEGLTVIKGLLEGESFSFKGDYYQIDEAICNPKPIKKIPIWLGETNRPEMVTNIVKHADMFNSMPCTIDDFQKKLNIVRDECDKQGRNYSELDLSLETQIFICDSEREIDRVFDSFRDLRQYNNSYDQDILDHMKSVNPSFGDNISRKDLEDEFLIGTPNIIKQKLDRFIEKGVSHFMLWFMDYPDQQGIKLFAERVLSEFN